MAIDVEEVVAPGDLGAGTHAFLNFSSLHYQTPDYHLE